MKYTLLEIVQDVLSSMDSDEVTSINDTVESQQVVKVIRTAYFDIINRSQLPEHYDLRQLDETDADTPVVMTIPDDIVEVKWVKYNHATDADPEIHMVEVQFRPLKHFIDMTDRLDPNADDVDSMTLTVGGDDHTILFQTTGGPRYYTTTDDNKIIFDSYDSNVEDYLQKTNSRAYCRQTVEFTESDVFVPDLDETQFQLLLSEAKSLAWIELKQTPHSKAEQSAKRAWTQVQKNKFRVKGMSDFQALPSFGRKY